MASHPDLTPDSRVNVSRACDECEEETRDVRDGRTYDARARVRRLT